MPARRRPRQRSGRLRLARRRRRGIFAVPAARDDQLRLQFRDQAKRLFPVLRFSAHFVSVPLPNDQVPQVKNFDFPICQKNPLHPKPDCLGRRGRVARKPPFSLTITRPAPDPPRTIRRLPQGNKQDRFAGPPASEDENRRRGKIASDRRNPRRIPGGRVRS